MGNTTSWGTTPFDSGRYAKLIARDPPYDADMDRLRVAITVVALLAPSVVFAFNAYISYRERGLVEPYDIPAAIAIYLASVVVSGPAVFIAYWVVALVLTIQALPRVRRPEASST